ncbi:MAG TPA: hypothetical protein VK662_09330 [Acidothermaceae bacterium]|jgi:hypothetical protein|nr:hypothetical protein [Acidothermaceae bacterium]
MRYKATFVIGIAAGYVLGARAGRQRYEQIKRLTQTVKKNPAVQSAAGRVQAQATQLSTQARRVVQDKAGSVTHDLVGKVTGRFGNHTIVLDDDRAYSNGTIN